MGDAVRGAIDVIAQLQADLIAARAERDEALVHLSIAQGPDPEQTFEEIGMAGRKTTLGKHKAVNYAHIRKVIADLDAAGMVEAADTLLWAHWWRQNERAWTKWMRGSCLEQQQAAEAERDSLRIRLQEAERALHLAVAAVEDGKFIIPDGETYRAMKFALATIPATKEAGDV